MKNIHILSCALLTNIAAHCMDQTSQLTPTPQPQINLSKDIDLFATKNDPLDNPWTDTHLSLFSNPWKSIDICLIEKSLENDCKAYLTNRLEEYKKVDFTSQDMDQIRKTCTCITGKPTYCSTVITTIHDEKNNSFIHHAVQKPDLNVATWLLKNKYLSRYKNSDGKEPIDLCIDMLLPGAAEDNLLTARAILALLIDKNSHPGLFLNLHRKNYLEKLVALQLEHTKHNTGFKLDDTLLPSLVFDQITLPKIYQTIVDKDKNSYTHILVQKNLADMLYEFIKNNYITFATNNDGQTPLAIAQENFRQHTSPTILSSLASFSPTRCCILMLLNYVRKQNKVTDFQQCCEKHTI